MAARDMKQEAKRELASSDAVRQWIRGRIDTLHEQVEAHDVLRRFGVKLRHGSDREEQIYCPFHGNTKTMAARLYTRTARSPSHVWCFVCNETWDCIGLWRKFMADEVGFVRALFQMEREFGITTPEVPPDVAPTWGETAPQELAEIDKLHDVCERRLIAAKRAFDMRGYLLVGSLLDRIRHDLNLGVAEPARVKPTLMALLNKIGEKERACPAG